MEELNTSKYRRKEFCKTCDCGKSYNVRSSYYAHKKKCQGSSENCQSPKQNFVCKEENCNFKSHTSVLFIEHLQNIHNIEVPSSEIKVFQKYSEFKQWKENFEKETKSFFVLKAKYKNLSGGRTEYYFCNRSGTYSSVSTGERSQKSQGMRKIGYNCPASLKVSINYDKVSVSVCKYHYGHLNELVHLPIPKSDRETIAMQLSQGIEPHRILKKIYGNQIDNVERKHLCTKRDLWNIKSSLFRQKKKCTENSNQSHDFEVSGALGVPEVTSNNHSLNNANEDQTSSVPVEGHFESSFLNSIDPSGKESIETIKRSLLEKHMRIVDKIKACDNIDLLIAARNHINNVYNILNLPSNFPHLTKMKVNKSSLSTARSKNKQQRFFSTKKKIHKITVKFSKPTFAEKINLQNRILNESCDETHIDHFYNLVEPVDLS